MEIEIMKAVSAGKATAISVAEHTGLDHADVISALAKLHKEKRIVRKKVNGMFEYSIHPPKPAPTKVTYAAPVQTTAYQIGGNHYSSMPVQPWAAMEAWMPAEAFRGYLLGNVIKYLSRLHVAGVDGKGGRQDAEKAKHYLERLIETMP